MKARLQPLGSSQCGQMCVAMLAGIPLEAACGVVGHGKGTTVEQIRRALLKLGFTCSAPIALDEAGCRALMGKRALVAVELPVHSLNPNAKPKRHWLLWDGYSWVDPARGRVAPDALTVFRIALMVDRA